MYNAESYAFCPPDNSAQDTTFCLWHANKNVQQYCKPKFTSKDTYDSFFQAWLGIVRSRDTSEYNSQLLQFSTEYSDTPEHQVQYVDKSLAENHENREFSRFP
jgi:hypothetical protein